MWWPEHFSSLSGAQQPAPHRIATSPGTQLQPTQGWTFPPTTGLCLIPFPFSEMQQQRLMNVCLLPDSSPKRICFLIYVFPITCLNRSAGFEIPKVRRNKWEELEFPERGLWSPTWAWHNRFQVFLLCPSDGSGKCQLIAWKIASVCQLPWKRFQIGWCTKTLWNLSLYDSFEAKHIDNKGISPEWDAMDKTLSRNLNCSYSANIPLSPLFFFFLI